MSLNFVPQLCPNLHCHFHSNPGGTFHKAGFFHTKRLNRTYRRFRCSRCRKAFSSRTFKPDYKHKKPDLNAPLWKLLCEGASLRAAARLLDLTYYNTYLKFLWLSKHAQFTKNQLKLQAQDLYFDEMETIEHTKCKPVSLGLMVNEKYQILGAQVTEMPAKGRLHQVSVKKYGVRIDNREIMMKILFSDVQSRLVSDPMRALSDGKPSYPKFVKSFFPEALHEVYSREDKERYRNRLHEKLARKRFDPLFPLNQRCAKLRSDIKRLTRRSWCTTKKIENLQGHLDLYIVGHALGFCFV